MGIVVIVLTILILTKLRALRRRLQPVRILRSRENKFKQANRRSVGILLMSLIYVTLPSVGAGLAKAIGFPVLNVIGPFYIVGLLCAGACNSVVYLALNKEMQELARKFICCKKLPLSPTVVTIRALSTDGR
ncbi:hypothetical protein KIN20_015462 [Parelaphostrongylus tenuis]|uniref:Uncharacterized protein n=1 Tax=Parelaphostrongylus tenuis TaxID=148309 RepID=A0AAD5N460_PARTN|nr:hypothetical protein KIN20_015462 [Parelaphostrongylus tenuis]